MGSTVVRRDTWRRWSLVITGAAVLVALPAVVTALPASTTPTDPAALRSLILASDRQPHHGYAESNGLLGVPDLPNLTQVTSLLNGTTRMRTWYDSPDRWRFDVLSVGGERDYYRTPDGEYVWDYGANLLTQLIGAQQVRLPRAGDLLPPELARRVLAATPQEKVESLPARREAGISAAGLRVRPTDPDTSVGQVDIWADPVSGVPVRVEVTARGAGAPVVVTRFLELQLGRPELSALLPSKPRDGGFNVTTAPDVVAALGVNAPVFFPDRLAARELRTPDLFGLPGVGQYGSGLSAFVVLPLPRNLGGSATDAARKAGAADLTLPGGTAVTLTIAPVTVIVVRSNVARRSYLLAGLVTPALLERAANELSTVPRSGR